jgi:peptidoglycan/LPS O-acetylase OafA/YrhL
VVKNNYRPEIDGLRAIAVLSVVLFHANFSIFKGGFIGVDIFFVISGYLITRIIIKEQECNEFSYLNFYERRVRRILPALFFMVFCTILFFGFLMTPLDLKMFSRSVIATTFFGSNFLFWKESGSYFDSGSLWKPLHHTWSLSLEEQFYIFHPILLGLILKFRKNHQNLVFIFLISCSLCLSVSMINADPKADFYLLPTRFWELLFGALISNLDTSKFFKRVSIFFHDVLTFIGILFIFFSVFIFDSETKHPGIITLIPVLGSALVILFARENGLMRSILSNKLLVGIGLVSYSLYLWHYPIFVFAKYFFLNDPQPSTYILLIAASVIVAYFSYRFIESPLRDVHAISRKQIVSFFIFFSISFIAIGYVGHSSNGFPKRFNNKYNSLFEAQRIGLKDSCNCHGRNPSDACFIGKKLADPTWALIGDSHAGALASNLEQWLIKTDQGGMQFTQGGCPYVIGLSKTTSDPKNCNNLNEEVRKILLNSNLKNIIISGRYVRYFYKEGFNNGEGGVESSSEDSYFYFQKNSDESKRQRDILDAYKRSITELLKAGKTVFLIYPVPEIGWDVPRQTFKRINRNVPGNLTVSYKAFEERSLPVINAFDELAIFPNLIRIYPSEIFCNQINPGRCETVINGQTIYFDDDHVSIYGAKLIIDTIFKRFERKK